MRTPEQIKDQIDGLEILKASLPLFSKFGTPNHEIIDTQISILNGSAELSDIDEGDIENMDIQNRIYRGAEEAQEWLEGNRDENLFE